MRTKFLLLFCFLLIFMLTVTAHAQLPLNTYNNAGAYVISIRVQAGEKTSITLPADFYIVKTDNN